MLIAGPLIRVSVILALALASPAMAAPKKPAPQVKRALPVAPQAPDKEQQEFEATLRLQIFLDQALFGPGQIDGRPGEFTRKAVAAWNVVHGVADVDDQTRVQAEADRAVTVPYAAYRMREQDFKWITPGLPTKPEEQVKAKYMGYRSTAEFVCERYHCSEVLLAKLNPKASIHSLKAGQVVKVPNVKPFELEALKDSQQWAADPTLSAHTVLVDTKVKTAAFYDPKGDLFALMPITPGKPKFVPLGEWRIEIVLALPEFRWDKQMLEKGKRGKDAYMIPPGPNSPVGVFWAGLNRSGIGLHGTASPETIGRTQSAGCIRFANWDAVRLPGLIRPGTRVIVQ